MIAHETPAIPAPAGPGPTVRVPGRVCRDKTPLIQPITGSLSGVPDTEPSGIDGRVPVSVGRKSNHINRLTLPCRNRVSGENAVKTMAWPPGVGIACRGDCVSGVGVSDPTCRGLIQIYQSLSVTVSDLRVGEKVNEINGVGCRGLLYIHIWVCSRNTHPYWLGLRPGPGTASHPPAFSMTARRPGRRRDAGRLVGLAPSSIARRNRPSTIATKGQRQTMT